MIYENEEKTSGQEEGTNAMVFGGVFSPGWGLGSLSGATGRACRSSMKPLQQIATCESSPEAQAAAKLRG